MDRFVLVLGQQFRFDTVCPRSSDPFYIVGYYIKWVTTSWTYSTYKYKMDKTSWIDSIRQFRPLIKLFNL